jgi:uncharacterized C2H2 Zn-finger protein
MERASSMKLSSSVGLLTTIHQLPNSYKVQYIKIKAESPLDLTIKPYNDHVMTPPSTPSPLKKRYRETENDQHFTIRNEEVENKILSPLKKRYREDDELKQIKTTKIVLASQQPQQQQQQQQKQQIVQETTPKKSITTTSVKVNQKSSKNPPQSAQLPAKERKSKAIRKLKFDEFRSSPVSGTIIRTLEEIDENDIQESGDIDPQYNIVEVTDEAKAELAQIPNVIGAYLCKLCRIEFEDAFGLARHRCNCIVLLEYRCPECGKKFNCPANLASHRRWHKPRDQINKKSDTSNDNEPAFKCNECGKNFKRQAYLKKHQATHTKKSSRDETSKVSLVKTTSNSQHETSSVSSFNAFSTRSHDSADVLIPQPVFNFNNHIHSSAVSPSHSTDSSEHELVINENSNSSINSDNSSSHYKMLSNRFTEDENIAITALANLRSGSSVIRHTLTV